MPNFLLTTIITLYVILSAQPNVLFAQTKRANQSRFCDADYFALILVDARKLKISNFKACLRSLCSLRNEHNLYGHVWTLLVDKRNKRYWECGYSAEVDRSLPTFMEGFGLLLQGQISEQMSQYGADLRDPIGYLFIKRDDGYLQWGNGGHSPNCAMGVALTARQFEKVMEFVFNWKESTYSLEGSNCVHFAQKFASAGNVHLLFKSRKIFIPKFIRMGKEKVILREKSTFRSLSIITPEALSCSIKHRYRKEEIAFALSWYKIHKIEFTDSKQHYQQLHP